MSDPTSSATAAAAPTLRRGNYFGLGTYLGLAGALLAMIALFSALSSHFLSYVRESEINQKGKARKLWDIEEGKGI